MGEKRYNHGYKFLNFIVPEYGKWNLYRDLARKNLSHEAQLKLEWIIFYNTLGNHNASLTAQQFGISRKTFHKWLNRFSERNLLTLEEVSRKPEHVRTWSVSKEEENRIITLRKAYLKLGKSKLKVLYKELYGQSLSTWKIERIIRRHNLYPNKAEHQRFLKRREEAKPKLRIHTLKDTVQKVHEFGFLWHTDTVILWWNGKRVCILTAIEEHTRIAYARLYPNNTSTTTQDFLKRLLYVSDNKIRIMHSDNGSEFKGNFEKICNTLGILQAYSRVRTPKDNAILERFNRTIQEEWLALCEHGLDDLDLANQLLTDWLSFYNTKRPHQALDYKTPLQYAEDTFFKLLPMYPASTRR
jgi:transposase InsO family protein/transposase-like protein